MHFLGYKDLACYIVHSTYSLGVFVFGFGLIIYILFGTYSLGRAMN